MRLPTTIVVIVSLPRLTGRWPRAGLVALLVAALLLAMLPARGPVPASGAPATNGSVAAWGLNSSGQLGDGNTTNSSTAVLVSGLTGVTTVAAAGGGDHGLALRFDGTVRAWGRNDVGQLGNDTIINSLVPVTVLQTATPSPVPLSGISTIAAGQFHSLALKSDGTVWAWGNNNNGQLGDTTNTNSPVAVQVLTAPATPLTGITAIAGAAFHNLAIVGSTQTAVAWGLNSGGQLGNGVTGGAAWSPSPSAPPPA